MPDSPLAVMKGRPHTPSRAPLEGSGRGAAPAERLEPLLDALRAAAMRVLEDPSCREDLSDRLRELYARLEAQDAALDAVLTARSHGPYGALVAGHIARASAGQLARVRRLMRLSERAEATEAARAACVGACVLAVEAKALRADLELLLRETELRKAS